MPTKNTPAAPKQEYCNHINRHSVGTNGKPDGLWCALPKGHTGDHEAMHDEITQDGKGVTVLRQWSDAAG